MRKRRQKTGEFIPCMYLPYVSGSSLLMIYFHGNAEDVGLATDLLTFVKDRLCVSSFKSLKLLFIDSYSGDGVPGLRGLLGWPLSRTDCTRRSKLVWLFDYCSRHPREQNNSFRQVNWVWARDPRCILTKPGMFTSDVPFQVNPWHSEGTGRFVNSVCDLGPLQKHR